MIYSLFFPTDLESTIIFELSAQSSHFISVAFEHPFNECMATVELRLHAPQAAEKPAAATSASGKSITCTIHTGDRVADARNAERLSRIVQRCLSIPVAMRALIRLWELDQMRGPGVDGGDGGGGGDVGADVFQQQQLPPVLPPPKSEGGDVSMDGSNAGGASTAVNSATSGGVIGSSATGLLVDGSLLAQDTKVVTVSNIHEQLSGKRRRTEEFWNQQASAQQQAMKAVC